MNISLPDRKINIFSVIRRDDSYQKIDPEKIRTMVKLSDQYCYKGMLLFESNNGTMEPWVFGQFLLENSRNLSPFIAVNPAYMHPFAVAKKILTLTDFYQRKIYLNFIAGTTLSDLNSLGENIEHSKRYKRLSEYITLVLKLLTEPKPVSQKGQFYTVNNLSLPSQLQAGLLPDYFIAGSSSEAKDAINETSAGNLGMAKPLPDLLDNKILPPAKSGIHFGILTREDNNLTELVEATFPAMDEQEEILFYSMRNTDAKWKKDMADNLSNDLNNKSAYTLLPFRNLKSDCPYLIGSYENVAEEIVKYISLGITTLVVEVPSTDDFPHIEKAFKMAENKLLQFYSS
jgi:alkanesulfonate monooxygenase